MRNYYAEWIEYSRPKHPARSTWNWILAWSLTLCLNSYLSWMNYTDQFSFKLLTFIAAQLCAAVSGYYLGFWLRMLHGKVHLEKRWF